MGVGADVPKRPYTFTPELSRSNKALVSVDNKETIGNHSKREQKTHSTLGVTHTVTKVLSVPTGGS
jgi:hypothetical protein